MSVFSEETVASSERVSIGRTKSKGRGVFAERSFAEGALIEQAPVLVVPADQRPHIDQTMLYDYYFGWKEDLAIALGYGSCYNHSYEPNAIYAKRTAERKIDFVALRDIEVGEEITVNYNGAPDDDASLWFQPDP